MSSTSRKAKAAEMQAQLAQLSAVSDETAPAPPLPVANSRIRELASVALIQAPVEPPAPVAPVVPAPQGARGRQWRTQGVTVYPADDERVDRLATFFKKRRIKFGKRGNLSLLIGAGLAELDRLAATNPDALIAIVRATMSERESA